MSTDKPLSLPMPNPPVNSNTSSPRTGGSSILNGPAGSTAAGNGSGGGKVKTPTQSTAPTPSLQPNPHVLAHPTMPSPQTHTPGYAPHTSGPTAQYGYGAESSAFMAHSSQPYVGVGLDFQNQHHLSQPQPTNPQTATSGNSLSHYAPHPATMQPYAAGPHSSHAPYPQFHFPTATANGVSSPSQPGLSGQMGNALLPLPGSAGITPAPSPHTTLPPTPSQQSQTAQAPGASYGAAHTFDTTGQIAPPGMKPRVTATLWEDEGSLCFQVEAKGVCVARREDNHMINGTKLLNVAGMTRGRRDGILKSEKVRHVVKIGPMHLKGVWIPFERALDFANKEKITDLLYPLFVHNIGALLYHPTNTDRTSAVMAAVDRRRFESQQALVRRNPAESIPPSLHPPPMTPLHLNPTLSTHPQMRPDMAPRAITFPTPPSSATSIIASNDNPYWSTTGMMSNNNSQLAIDTVMNPTRSLPSTPATTPPGGSLSQLQQYPPQNFNDSRSSPLYPSQASSLPQQAVTQHNMTRFGSLPQPNQFMNQSRDNNMGPPSTSRQSNSRPSSRQNTSDGQVKDENGVEVQSTLEEPEQDANQEEAENDPEQEVYHHDANQYSNGTNRYFNNVEHAPHLSPDMTGSPNHQAPGTPNRSTYNNSSVAVSRNMENGGGSTPRTGTTPQQQWVPNSGYSTPPVGASTNSGGRHQPSGRPYEGTNGTTNSDNYGQHGMSVTPQNQFSNGINGSAKRYREIDDQEDNGSRPSSRDQEERGAETDMSLKRRKTISQGSIQNGAAVNGSSMDKDASRINRSRPTVAQNRRQR